MALLGGLGIAALAAAPWLLRGAPSIGRGAKTMWNLGKGMGTPLGRRQAGRAVWQPRGSIPRNPTTGALMRFHLAQSTAPLIGIDDSLNGNKLL